MRNTRTTPTPPRLRNNAGLLDWTHAPLARATAPCIHCGNPALLRHPITGASCHKVCNDRHEQQTTPVD